MKPEAIIDLMKAVDDRLYDPGKYTPRNIGESLRSWQGRALLMMFSVIDHRVSDGKKVIVTMSKVEGQDVSTPSERKSTSIIGIEKE